VPVRAGDHEFAADDVVIACGIWGPALAWLVDIRMPLTPVAHPYVYGARRSVPHPPSPFVRRPEHHVYARDHGDRDGMGTYDHMPVPVPLSQLTGRADQPWPGELFDDAVVPPQGEMDDPAPRRENAR
jgi:glycine/D-amino acid oxidase-like deaminating enzyme